MAPIPRPSSPPPATLQFSSRPKGSTPGQGHSLRSQVGTAKAYQPDGPSSCLPGELRQVLPRGGGQEPLASARPVLSLASDLP